MRLQTFTQLGFLALMMTVVAVGVSDAAVAQNREPVGSSLPETDTVVTLGQPCNHPYVVAVPGANPNILSRVQAFVPSAFVTDSRLGAYVQAGSSPRRAPAETVSRQLRREGLDARVIYRPIECESFQSP